ncbi:flagellar basal body P-ring formation chaperone FlgA [Planctomycetota bacterium]
MRIQGYKSARILIACSVMVFALFCQVSAKNTTSNLHKNFDLRIYLPREVTVKDANLTLGQVSVIQGRESLIAKANNVAIGRISITNQNVVIDRSTVLSRLACSGIPSSKVVFTGAKETTVRRKQRAISSQELVTLASSFLKSHPPDASVCQWSVIRKPKDLVIPETGEGMRFSPRLILNNRKNQAKVEITVSCGGKKAGVRDVIFALKYNRRQAVTITPIPKGAIIGPENVKIEVILSHYPEAADWKSPYGLATNRPLAANTILRTSMVGSGKSPVVVKRNQNVVIRIEKPGFLITASGMTLEDGRIGEHIRIRNVDSKRIILARINEDGSVEPVL